MLRLLGNFSHQATAATLKQYNMSIFGSLCLHDHSLYILNPLACVALVCIAGTLPSLKQLRVTGESRKCRFFPAWDCNILHAGVVDERQLQVFHHGKSSAHAADPLQENDRLMRHK
jgi:hypothetical protein